jgi:hypothetical protein
LLIKPLPGIRLILLWKDTLEIKDRLVEDLVGVQVVLEVEVLGAGAEVAVEEAEVGKGRCSSLKIS